MSIYRNLLMASALAFGACDTKSSYAQEAPKKESVHDEIPGIQHLSGDLPKGTKRWAAVICGNPVNSPSNLNFSYLDKEMMSCYHVLPEEPLAKKLGLRAGETLFYQNGKEVCRVQSTNSRDIAFETGYHFGATGIPPPACQDALRAGKKAPDFEYTVFGTDKKLSLKSLEEKVVLLDIGATWCGPCMKLKPYLEELHGKYPDVELIWLSVDKPGELEKYLSGKKPKYDHIVNDTGYEGGKSKILKSYQVVGIPEVYLIDQKGVIAGRNLHWDAEKNIFTTVKLEEKIKELLKK